jgi:hypothetical protein
MRNRVAILLAGSVGAVLLIAVSQTVILSSAEKSAPDSVVGSAATLLAGYTRWKDATNRSGQAGTIRLALSLPKSHVSARNTKGTANLDLADGRLNLQLAGLAGHAQYKAWIQSNDGEGARPSKANRLLISFSASADGRARVDVALDRASLVGYRLERLLITAANDEGLADRPILSGSPNLYQRLYPNVA